MHDAVAMSAPPVDRDGPVLGVVVSTQRRGAEIFATDLAEALDDCGVKTRTVALIPGQGSAPLELPTLGRTRLGLPTLRALRGEAGRAAAVIAHGSSTLPASALATLGLATPFVYRNINDPLYWSATPARRLRVMGALRRAAAVAALWPGVVPTLTGRYGVPAAKIRVIPNGVPAVRFPWVDQTERASARAELGLEADRPIVVYLGHLAAEKYVHVAIAALSFLPEVELVVAGRGPERSRLQALATELAPGRVRFLGTTGEPARVLAAADALVLPSETEGMPAVLIEAGMSGVPTVATPVAGVPEVVVDGETGRLVLPGDPKALAEALKEVLAEPGDLGRAARAHCLKHFEIAVVAAQWHELLAEVADHRPRWDKSRDGN